MSPRKLPSDNAKPAKPAKANVPKPSRPPRDLPAKLEILNPNAAGIDVHSDMHMVCVPAERVLPGGDASDGLRAGQGTCADVGGRTSQTNVPAARTPPIPVSRQL